MTRDAEVLSWELWKEAELPMIDERAVRSGMRWAQAYLAVDRLGRSGVVASHSTDRTYAVSRNRGIA